MRLAGGSLAKIERQALERRLDECEVCRRFVAEVLRQEEESQGGAAATTVDPAGRTVLERRGSERGGEARRGGGPTRPGAPAASPATGGDGAVTADSGAAGPARPPLRLPVPGQRVDRYVIERPLGAGGMGLVNLARDEELKRHVVIKLVRPDLISSQPPERGETLEARLIREAQALARLSHPCVVSIFDIGRYDGQVFFAMEFVEGVDLASYLQAERRSPQDILAKFRQAGVGLGAAHRAGVVHRDFKPANVLVGDNGVVKVADFGLARGVADPMSSATLSGRGPQARARRSSMLDAALTQVDSTVGTPAYMAPEQIAGEGVDARSDQFAFAVALVDALLGQSPAARLIHPQTASDADLALLDRALAGVGAPPQHRAALLRALAQEPSARFASIEELLAQLGDAVAPGSSPGVVPPAPRSYAPATGDGAPPPSPQGLASGPGPQLLPPQPQPQLQQPAPRPPPRRGRALALGLVAALGAAAVTAWALRARQGADAGDCAARRQAILAAFPAERRRRLIAALPAAAPFERWTAETAAAALEQRLAALADAHQAQCQRPAAASSAPPCQLTGAAELEQRLATARTSDDLFAAAAAAVSSCSTPPSPPSLAEPAARPALGAITAGLADGPLAEVQARAERLAGELSERAPITAAEAYRLAAVAAALAQSGEEEELAARSAAAAERAGDDGRRAQALLLELDAALLGFDAPRVEQLAGLLRSLVARRGGQPRDRAEVEALIAAAHDRLGRYLASADEWPQVAALAASAGDRRLAARATLGELMAKARAGREVAQSRRALRQLLEQRQQLLDAGAGDVWSLAVASALELGEPVTAELTRAAAELRAPHRDIAAADLRLRAAAVPGDQPGDDWFGAAIDAATDQGRSREAIELALEHARRRVAAAVVAASSSAPSDASAGALGEAAVASLSRVNSLLLRHWSPQPRRPTVEPELRMAMLQAELIEHGVGASVFSPISANLYKALPADSLLRAEAAWRHARHGEKTSRYLQNQEELEEAMSLWQRLGRRDRVARAAWWIASRGIVRKERARELAQLALELYRQIGDDDAAAAAAAWLASHPEK